MEFIRNEKEREKIFFKLWNEEVNINPKNYKFIFGNDIQFFRGITQEELQKIFEFCNKYHKLFNLTGKKSPTSIGGAMNCPIVF